jgi:hypothetical protein
MEERGEIPCLLCGEVVPVERAGDGDCVVLPGSGVWGCFPPPSSDAPRCVTYLLCEPCYRLIAGDAPDPAAQEAWLRIVTRLYGELESDAA